MSNTTTCPDPSQILNGLKDFQRNTVEHVFRRLYLDADPSDRFLVADEVGLGKTLVARGLIAKTIEHLWDKSDRINIVYICSNGDIARQNIQRLNITGSKDFSLASRITLLPLQLHNLQENRINFISFTPGTSFDLKSNLGIAEERVLLYWLLHQAWQLPAGVAPMNVLQGGSGTESFRNQIKQFQQYKTIDKSLAAAFCRKLKQQVEVDQQVGHPDLNTRFNNLCKLFSRARIHSNIPHEERQERNDVIGELRELLAQACISVLEPDLIVLDEFQRFKHLLEPGTEVSQLATDLFNHSGAHSSTKVVLLSATPYKMYTLSHEVAEDNHYEDFLRTIQFLQSDTTQTKAFENLLVEYRRELLRLQQGNYEKLLELKSKLEHALRRIMVRTERLAASADRDGMLAEIPCATTKLESQDLDAYLSLQNIARILEHPDTLEYWKSAPYLLNFMDKYELKDLFTKALNHRDQSSIADAIAQSSHLLLSRQDLEKYRKIDPCNARLRGLLADTVGTGAWKLLWIVPSLPYYQLGGVFADLKQANFTKRLVFSSWRVVPKVIATLLSYEAERQMICLAEGKAENTPEARRRRRPLLRFTRHKDGKLTGMPVLSLLYPSTVLAKECDPLTFAINSGSLCLPTVLARVQHKIESLLQSLPIQSLDSGPEDESWYWVAPLLLDRHFEPEATREWFERYDLANLWTGEEQQDDEYDGSLWSEHVKKAKEVVEAPCLTLGKPPKDLSLVLAQMAIASPGVVALRALARIVGGSSMLTDTDIRTSAARIAWSFRTLFNSPEATALIRGMKSEDSYWQGVLEYCMDGCLQSVLDEYVHILHESLGLANQSSTEIAKGISNAITKSLTLRTSVMAVDDITVNKKQGKVSIADYRMRGHFALRFGDEQHENEKGLNRTEQVREAFNSPFRPFVLATTSVGQEGLDFHPYCHAIVHWNLPSNPVDLEQREGRVHRYKGHAVRKNLALKYGMSEITASIGDPWQHLFDAGKRDRPLGSSDLIPFWIYPVEQGARIERYVPTLPLSRDCERLVTLRRSLAAYRMVFGQSRQEDLLAYLLDKLPESNAGEIMCNFQINLEPS